MKEKWFFFFSSFPQLSVHVSCDLVTVLLHAEVRAAMLHKHVRLHEGLRVQQELHSLPGRQFTLQNIITEVTMDTAALEFSSSNCL